MNHKEYKKKHDWYDSNVVTLEKQFAVVRHASAPRITT